MTRYILELVLTGPDGTKHHRTVGIELSQPAPKTFANRFGEFVREVVEDCVRDDQLFPAQSRER